MFKKLLVCTDGSPYGDVACRYGFQLAAALKAQLTALHELDIRMIEGPLLADVAGAIGAAGYYAGLTQFKFLMDAKGEAVRQNFMELARQAGSNAELQVDTGHPVHAILEQEGSVDMLILGQRGENEQYGRELIGSVADRVTRRSSKPCLVTPGQYVQITRILAACDGSPISEKVARMAAELAKALNAGLTVVTVAEKGQTSSVKPIADAAERTCIAAGCSPKVVVSEGLASEVLLDTIVKEGINMIVMGAHAHSRVREWFVGCTSQRIMSDASICTLLVR